MSKITISFENDDRTIEIDEKTIKDIPFLQSYCNFNGYSSNIIELDCTSYDEFKLILDTVTTKRIDLINIIQNNNLTNFLNNADYFGILSNKIGNIYADLIMDHIKKYPFDLHKNIIEAQNFIDNNDIKIVFTELDLFNKLIPIMSNYKDVLPVYKIRENIFIGYIPIPISVSIESSISIDNIIENNFVDILNSKGKINKLLFSLFCLCFGYSSSDACIAALTRNYEFDSFAITLDRIYKHITSVIEYRYEEVSIIAEYFQKHFKTFSDNNILNLEEDLIVEIDNDGYERDIAKTIWDSLPGHLNYYVDDKLPYPKYKCREVLSAYYKVASFYKKELNSNDNSFLYMTDDEINILHNRDKYIDLIGKEQLSDLKFGFIKKID